jgi:hypothetical protein
MDYGDIVMLSEISLAASIDHKRVRVTGTVASVDHSKRVCMLVHRNASLWIDLSLVDISIFRTDSMCQVIGELRPGNSKVFLVKGQRLNYITVV